MSSALTLRMNKRISLISALVIKLDCPTVSTLVSVTYPEHSSPAFFLRIGISVCPRLPKRIDTRVIILVRNTVPI